MHKTERVIITGAPGTGKSTILDALKNMGFPCHPEVSRAVIKQQLQLKTDFLPWKDVSGFSELVHQGQSKQYYEAIEGQWNFFDRGAPDVLAYLRKINIHHNDLENSCQNLKYYPSVFLTPPWLEIYSQDEERKEGLDEMIQIHNHLKKVYTDFGYNVIEVPKIPIQQRVDFILETLAI